MDCLWLVTDGDRDFELKPPIKAQNRSQFWTGETRLLLRNWMTFPLRFSTMQCRLQSSNVLHFSRGRRRSYNIYRTRNSISSQKRKSSCVSASNTDEVERFSGKPRSLSYLVSYWFQIPRKETWSQILASLTNIINLQQTERKGIINL